MCSLDRRNVEMLGKQRTWRGDYDYVIMFRLVLVGVLGNPLHPISVQVGDGSNTNRNMPVTVFGSGVLSVALGVVRCI